MLAKIQYMPSSRLWGNMHPSTMLVEMQTGIYIEGNLTISSKTTYIFILWSNNPTSRNLLQTIRIYVHIIIHFSTIYDWNILRNTQIWIFGYLWRFKYSFKCRRLIYTMVHYCFTQWPLYLHSKERPRRDWGRPLRLLKTDFFNFLFFF